MTSHLVWKIYNGQTSRKITRCSSKLLNSQCFFLINKIHSLNWYIQVCFRFALSYRDVYFVDDVVKGEKIYLRDCLKTSLDGIWGSSVVRRGYRYLHVTLDSRGKLIIVASYYFVITLTTVQPGHLFFHSVVSWIWEECQREPNRALWVISSVHLGPKLIKVQPKRHRVGILWVCIW